MRKAYSSQIYGVFSNLCETCLHHMHAMCACLVQLNVHINMLLPLGTFLFADCSTCLENSNLCADSALHVAMQLLLTCLTRDCYHKTSWL